MTILAYIGIGIAVLLLLFIYATLTLFLWQTGHKVIGWMLFWALPLAVWVWLGVWYYHSLPK